jgi:hypothetical protein
MANTQFFRIVTITSVMQKLEGENLKVLWAEFSSLIWAVLLLGMPLNGNHTHPHLDLKTRPRFILASLSLSTDILLFILFDFYFNSMFIL